MNDVSLCVLATDRENVKHFGKIAFFFLKKTWPTTSYHFFEQTDLFFCFVLHKIFTALHVSWDLGKIESESTKQFPVLKVTGF